MTQIVRALSVGKVAKECGCSISTVRYWMRRGVISAAPRLDGSEHRRFRLSEVAKLKEHLLTIGRIPAPVPVSLEMQLALYLDGLKPLAKQSAAWLMANSSAQRPRSTRDLMEGACISAAYSQKLMNAFLRRGLIERRQGTRYVCGTASWLLWWVGPVDAEMRRAS